MIGYHFNLSTCLYFSELETYSEEIIAKKPDFLCR